MNDVYDLTDKELIDEYAKETERRYGNKRITDWKTPIGMKDPGALVDPERRRGSDLTRQEKDWVYYWARRKRVWREHHMVCGCWDECPTCKLCRCSSVARIGCKKQYHKYEDAYRCLCGNGFKMLSPSVFRPMPIDREPLVIS